VRPQQIQMQTLLHSLAIAVLTAVLLIASAPSQADPSPKRAPHSPAMAPPTPVDLTTEAGRETVRKRSERILVRRDAMTTPGGRKATMKRFFDLDLWKGMYWFGIPVLKSPSDMWMMQQVISEVRPDYIVEAGTFYGGSALY
jgi:hypothetical protein